MERFELSTSGLQNRRSAKLSYTGISPYWSGWADFDSRYPSPKLGALKQTMLHPDGQNNYLAILLFYQRIKELSIGIFNLTQKSLDGIIKIEC